MISYASAKEIARVRVGDHPQRMRMGAYRSNLLPGDRVAPRLSRLKVVRRGRGRLRLRASEAVRLAIDARKVRRDGRRTRRVQTVRRRVRAGTSRVGLGRLSAGSYRLIVSARDAADNQAKGRRVGFRERRLR